MSQPVSAAAVTLNVQNTAGLNNADYLVIGKVGSEKTELVNITAAVSSNTQLTVSALKFDHSTDTPVTFTKFNQVRFYKSTDGGTVYSIYTTVALAVDRLITTADDTTSLASYYYKATFYNSTSGKESSFSAVLPGSGFPWYSVHSLQDRVIDLFPDPSEEILTRAQLVSWFNEEYRRLISLTSKIDQGIFLKTNEDAPSSLVSGTKAYSLPTDFKSMKKVEISYDGITYYRAYPQQEGYGYPTMVYDKTAPLYIVLHNTVEFRPTADSSNGRYKLWYYYQSEPFDMDDDTIDLPIRPYLDAIVFHALTRAKQKNKQFDEAEYWDGQAKSVETLMQNELQSRTTTDIPRWIDISDTSFLDVEGGWPFEL